MRPPGWAESGFHVWNWKYPEASLHVRIQGVQCCLSSFPRNEKKVTSSMFHHYNRALTPILNPFAHLLLHYTPWVTLSPSGIQLLDHLAPALTLTLCQEPQVGTCVAQLASSMSLVRFLCHSNNSVTLSPLSINL